LEVLRDRALVAATNVTHRDDRPPPVLKLWVGMPRHGAHKKLLVLKLLVLAQGVEP
jgi:hypothetical protein